MIYLLTGFIPHFELNHGLNQYAGSLLPEQRIHIGVQLRAKDLGLGITTQAQSSNYEVSSQNSFAEFGTDIRPPRQVPQSYSQRKPFICFKCNRSYVRKDYLKRHLTLECGVPPQFSCDYCIYKAKHKADLKRHTLLKHRNQFEQFRVKY